MSVRISLSLARSLASVNTCVCVSVEGWLLLLGMLLVLCSSCVFVKGLRICSESGGGGVRALGGYMYV